MTIPSVDNTTVNNLAPNLDYGDVADPALRLAAFQYIYNKLQEIVSDLNAYQGAGAVGTAQLANLGVTTGKLAELAVTTGKIAELAVTTAKINDLAVTLAKMAANSVGSTQLIDLSVITAKLNDLAVTTLKLADLSVTTAKLAELSVTNPKLAEDAVDGRVLAPGSVDSQHIAGTLLASAASLATQSEFDKRGVNVQKYSDLVVDGDWTAAFASAVDALGTNGGEIFAPAGTYIANVVVDINKVKLVGSGLGSTIIKSTNTQPALTIKSSDGTPITGCSFEDICLQATASGGGTLINGRENSFVNVKWDQCSGYGIKHENNLAGGGLNQFVNCQFYRNGGAGGVIIPPNDANGYANGNMFTNCWFDRYGDNVPTIDCGTSVAIVGGWLQGRNFAGIKIRTINAIVRAVGLRVDSTSTSHVLLEFTEGATLTCARFSGCDVDGQYTDGTVTEHANTLNGSTTTKLENNVVTRYFKDSQHDLFDLGGDRLEGIKIGLHRVFWSPGDPATAFPTRLSTRGDIAFVTNPSATGTFQLYICITSGTPGTWQGFGRKATAQADSTATDVAGIVADFNTLLARLRTAGFIAP